MSLSKNFGRHLIDDETHSDFPLKMKEGKELKVSSEVLVYNSSVFQKLIKELGITSHEVDDFEDAAVECFVDCLYSGGIDRLTKPVFREVNKMTQVFKVDWLLERCDEYFKGLVRAATSNYCYSEMLYIFEEAEYVFRAFKDNRYSGLVIKAMSMTCQKNAQECEDFIETYTASHNINSLTRSQLDTLVGAEEILVKYLTKCIRESKCLTQNVLYLLQNLDLVRCLVCEKEIYTGLFDAIKELKDLKKEELKLISEIQSDSSKRAVTNFLEIPSLFCSFTNFSELKFPDLLDVLGQAEEVKTLYMYIDGICFWMYRNHKEVPSWTNEIARRIGEVKEKRKWRQISKSYLDSWKIKVNPIMSTYVENWEMKIDSIKSFFTSLSECKELVTSHKFPLTSSRILAGDFFTKPMSIKFEQNLANEEPNVVCIINVTSTPRAEDHSEKSLVKVQMCVQMCEESVPMLKMISEDGEKAYPQEMHLSLALTGNWRRRRYNNWTPVPPMSWTHCDVNWSHWNESSVDHMHWYVTDNYRKLVESVIIHERDDWFDFKLYY